ncbi:hypothetical protein SRIMM317S_04873 [Streptomyces rimosus subsp. rimosus]
MRSAARLRSAMVSGRPCALFDSTARTKASASSPSKNRTANCRPGRGVVLLVIGALPSITRIVARCAMMGGSGRLCHRQHLDVLRIFPGYARRAGHRQ